MAKIIDGIRLAHPLKEAIANEVAGLKAHYIEPCLAIISVGSNAASKIYIKAKRLQAKQVGIIVHDYNLDEQISAANLKSRIDALNADPQVHGIIIQLPLPPHLNARAMVNCVDPLKDVDGLHIVNAGKLACGEEAIVPCTPLGCLLLLRRECAQLAGLHALVIGRSMLVGRPMAALLLQQDCTVTVAHSKTANLPELCRIADIVVAAVGQPLCVRKEWVKPGAIILDVGINRLPNGTIAGDVDFKGVSDIAGAVSPRTRRGRADDGCMLAFKYHPYSSAPT